MKICIINNLYPPYARGGAEQVVAKTVNGLLKKDHEVVVITTSPAGGSYCEMDTRLTTYRFRPKNLFFYTEAHNYHWFKRLIWHVIDIFHFGSAGYIKKILIKENPDVVHTHNFMGLGFLTPWIIRRLNLRHFHTVHDVQLVEPSGIILKEKQDDWRYTGIHVKIYSWLMKVLLGSPDVVISPSQFLLDFYHKRGFFPNSKRVMLRNPITFEQHAKIQGYKDSEILNFLYLGQIEEHKGVPFLVDTFLEFKKENFVPVNLHVVGDGSKLKDIKKIPANSSDIKIYGRIARENLPEIFKKMDVMIVPSLCYENSPTVIFESFSFGIPVLASDIEGIAELIQAGENGWTFKAGDKDSLKERIEWCFKNRDRVDQMSNGTAKFLEGLGQKEYVERLEKLYIA
ncbi:MAG: glycosyltransferase [Candidatus Magasanikbacteria bacterium]|nr:glycosyltransferase [Candidatus Magasanikbacteria bacterium]